MRSIDVFVSRLYPSTTVEEIVELVHSVKNDLNVRDVKVEKLPSRQEGLYSSFHVEICVSPDHIKNAIDLYMSSQAWPMGVFVRRYFRPKNAA